MPHDPDSNPAADPSLLILRKRLGRIRHLDEGKNFGFIEAEDYRDDVFFHLSQWKTTGPRNRGPSAGDIVEFEIDELHRRQEGKLRAKWVRHTDRPLGAKLSGKTDPHLMVKHHPKARQSKPKWRSKKSSEE